MRKFRLVIFVVAILFGLAAGLALGWSVNLSGQSGGGLTALRADFRADYILMVAEAFQADRNAALAVQRLAPLGDNPARQVQLAILTAADLSWSRQDVEVMARLSQALQGPVGSKP